MKNSERRTLAHKELLDRVREKAKHLQVYRLILIDLVIAGAFIEIKSIEEDAVRQARSALAQLYHYKFVYREQYGDPALLAIFGKEPIAEGNNLSIFLAHCRIASAWWNRSANLFDGTAEAKRIAPWLFK